jgi:cell division septal protein FtsQ
VDRLLTSNDAFAIHQVEVQNDGEIAPEQIRRWARVSVGQNLLALDLSRIKRDLELVPYIKTATVERVLPHLLRLRVIEREPLAQVRAPQPRPDGSYEMAVLYLDEDACLMPPVEARQRIGPAPQPPPVYPVITGIDFAQVAPGRQLDLPQVRAALQLVIAFGRSSMVGLDDLRQIDVSSPEVLLVRTAQGSEVIFATRDLDRQLWRWRRIYDAGQSQQKCIASLDLAVSNNIPARWLEASVPPPSKPVKPSRPKKKNV